MCAMFCFDESVLCGCMVWRTRPREMRVILVAEKVTVLMNISYRFCIMTNSQALKLLYLERI
jgi:hypothetical protein